MSALRSSWHFAGIDGTWSVPWTHDVTGQIESIPAGPSPLGLSASGFTGEDTLLIFVYRTAENYDDFGASNSTVTGLAVYGDGTFLSIASGQSGRYSELKYMFDVVIPRTGMIAKKASYKFAIDYDIPSSVSLTTATHNSGTLVNVSNAILKILLVAAQVKM